MGLRLKLLIISVACVFSLLLVLHVNNALDIAEIALGDSPGAPVIEFQFEDPCDSLAVVSMMVVITPDRAFLEISSSVRRPQAAPCEAAPFALIDTSNLQLRVSEGRVVEPSAKEGTLERTAGGSSWFSVPLSGGGPDARYQFASGALNAGFGESALQVQLRARNLACPEEAAVLQGGQASAAEKHCAIPLRATLQYANAEFDVAAALPPTYYLVTGTNVGREGSTKSYPTTRLVWAERATTPSDVIQGTLAGFEIHLVNRHDAALKQFITVAFSAVFGALVSMLLSPPFKAPEGAQPRTLPPGSTTPLLDSRGQAQALDTPHDDDPTAHRNFRSALSPLQWGLVLASVVVPVIVALATRREPKGRKRDSLSADRPAE